MVPSQSRVARVFVSSTFRDMHSERDHLASVVFPELREYCRARQVELIDVDLRWGVTEEEAENGKVLDICLEEIERSRPFFIALLGERYGWVPVPEEIGVTVFAELVKRLDAADIKFLESCYALSGTNESWQKKTGLSSELNDRIADLLEVAAHRPFGIPSNVAEENASPFRWLEKALAGQSVTALEIRHGVLENPTMKDRSYFYFRDPEGIATIPKAFRADASAENEGAARRLAALKAEIRAAYDPLSTNLYDYSPAWAGIRIDTELLRKRVGAEEGALDELDRVAGKDHLVDDEEYASLSPIARSLIDREGLIYFNRESLEGFGLQVLADLKRAVDAEFPEIPAPKTELEREALAHERIRLERQQGFQGRTAALDRVRAYLSGTEERTLVVLGEPGVGTSTLMSQAASLVHETDQGAFIIESYTGATIVSRDLFSLLKRIIDQLYERFSPDHPGRKHEPMSFDNLRERFFSVLGMASRLAEGMHVWIFVDALDQMGDSDDPQNLNWLPFRLPPAIRILVSANSGRVKTAAERRGLPTFILEPLSRDEAAELVTMRLARYRKSLGYDSHRKIDQLDLLLSKKAARFPLYLSVACEELRIYPRFEELTDRIGTMSDDTTALFVEILDRLERDYGEALVRKALSLIELSVNGLTEAEILELLAPEGENKLPPSRWLPIRRSIADHLSGRGEGSESFDIAHAQLSVSIWNRYLGEAKAKALYLLLATHGFSQLRSSLGHTDQIPNGIARDCAVYAYCAGDYGLLEGIWRETLAAVGEDTNGALAGVLKASLHKAGEGELDAGFIEMLRVFCDTQHSKTLQPIASAMGDEFVSKGRTSWAKEMYVLAMDCAENCGLLLQVASAADHLGDIDEETGDYETAETYFKKALGIHEEVARTLPDDRQAKERIHASFHNLAQLAAFRNENEKAKEYYRQALDIAEGFYRSDPGNPDNRDMLAQSISDFGSDNSLIVSASRLLSKSRALMLLKGTDGLDPVDPMDPVYSITYSTLYLELGLAAQMRGDSFLMPQYLAACSNDAEASFALDPDDINTTVLLAFGLMTQGDSFYALRDYERSLGCYRRSMAILEDLVAIDPSNSSSCCMLGVSFSMVARLS